MTSIRTEIGRRWENVDPLEFSDGVFYLPAMVELQPRQPSWGHPGQPGLRERVASDRPQGIGGEKLLCLLCMRIRVERNLPPAPVWLTFVEGRHGPMFRHEDGRSPHAEHQPETDTHKALKERKARTWEASGATKVDIEVWRPRARRRPDVLAVGPELTVAGEIQHSKERPRVIQARQKALAKAGDRVVWTTDLNAEDIHFLHLVPHLAVPALDDHRQYLNKERLEVAAGWTVFEEQRCGWSDMWLGAPRCPVTRKTTPCGGWHLYPTLNPNAYRPSPDTRFPCGPRPHLDHLLEGILRGSWLPYRQRNRVTWIPATAHDQVVDERGGGIEQAETPSAGPRGGRTAERVCEKRARSMASPQGTAPTANSLTTCCGRRPPGQFGRPLVNACQLCPESPTYWRRNQN